MYMSVLSEEEIKSQKGRKKYQKRLQYTSYSQQTESMNFTRER